MTPAEKRVSKCRRRAKRRIRVTYVTPALTADIVAEYRRSYPEIAAMWAKPRTQMIIPSELAVEWADPSRYRK